MRYSLPLALIPAFALASPAFAQTAPADAAEEGDIVVTAQKIEQRSIDVPITISAISGNRINELGVSDLDELSAYVPGLNIQEQSANNPGVVIRGITSDSRLGAAGAAGHALLQRRRHLALARVLSGDLRSRAGRGDQGPAGNPVRHRQRRGRDQPRPRPARARASPASITGGYGNFEQTLLSAASSMPAPTIRWPGALPSNGAPVTAISKTSQPQSGVRSFTRRTSSGVRASLRWTRRPATSTVDLIGTYDQPAQRRHARSSRAASRAFWARRADGPANAFGPANLGGNRRARQRCWATTSSASTARSMT